MEILQNFVAFSEYINFNILKLSDLCLPLFVHMIIEWPEIGFHIKVNVFITRFFFWNFASFKKRWRYEYIKPRFPRYPVTRWTQDHWIILGLIPVGQILTLVLTMEAALFLIVNLNKNSDRKRLFCKKLNFWAFEMKKY